MKKGKIKLLTYGMVTMRKERTFHASFWSESCFQYSEKKDAVFWDINGRAFCSFVEDGVPKLERIGRKSYPNPTYLKVVFLSVENMGFVVESTTYDNNEKGLKKAKKDAEFGLLTSRFITHDGDFFN